MSLDYLCPSLLRQGMPRLVLDSGIPLGDCVQSVSMDINKAKFGNKKLCELDSVTRTKYENLL